MTAHESVRFFFLSYLTNAGQDPYQDNFSASRYVEGGSCALLFALFDIQQGASRVPPSTGILSNLDVGATLAVALNLMGLSRVVQMHDLKVCHPERNDNGVEGSTHHRGASTQIGAQILRLPSVAQDDSWGGAVDRVGLSVIDTLRATARVAPTRSSADFANSHWVS